jgi:anaerobic magnesium-protoporphyrin IX monomethyl ester cyclase
MAKVLLINPPLTNEEIYSDYAVASAVLPPLGLCYIASILEKNHHEVKIIDGVAEKTGSRELIRRIKEFSPDIVGLSAMTVGFNRAVQTAKLVKQVNTSIITLIGGPHVSSIPVKVFQEHDCFDIGVVGEGEYTARELVSLLEKSKFKNYKKILRKIRGIVYKQDDKSKKIILNERREPIQNLDELPLPARHLLPDIKHYNLILMNQKPNFASIVPSRGCPFQCIYCDQNVFGRTWRRFSNEYIMNEIGELVTKYHVRTLQIQDDLFTLKRESVVQFCNMLKEKKFNIKWNLSSRVNLIDEPLAKLMKETGCEIVYFGIESGNQEVLNKIKKGITLKQIRKGVAITKKAGMSPHGSFIIGLPFDTKETIEETINFALSLPLDIASFHIATPYPHTEFEAIAPDFGLIHIKDYSQYRGHPNEVVFTPKGISGEYLLKKQKEAYRRFFLRPKMIMNKLKDINNFEKFKMYLKGAISLLKPKKNKHNNLAL